MLPYLSSIMCGCVHNTATDAATSYPVRANTLNPFTPGNTYFDVIQGSPLYTGNVKCWLVRRPLTMLRCISEEAGNYCHL